MNEADLVELRRGVGASVPDRATQASPGAADASPPSGEYPSRDELLRRIADVRIVLQGYFHSASDRHTACDHGRMYFEDCIGCYDEAIEAALDGNPQPETIRARQFERPPASAMSARSGETERLAPKDASAVGDSRDAQKDTSHD